MLVAHFHHLCIFLCRYRSLIGDRIRHQQITVTYLHLLVKTNITRYSLISIIKCFSKTLNTAIIFAPFRHWVFIFFFQYIELQIMRIKTLSVECAIHYFLFVIKVRYFVKHASIAGGSHRTCALSIVHRKLVFVLFSCFYYKVGMCFSCLCHGLSLFNLIFRF